MAMDMKFRTELKKMLDDGEPDQKIISFVLAHAHDEWPRAIAIWAYQFVKQYDMF